MGAMGRLFLLVFLAVVALVVITLIDCLSTDDAEIRSLPRPAWVLLILFTAPIGPIAWIVYGRPKRAEAGGALPGWHPAGSAAGRSRRAVAPDDDPEFLRELGARTKRTKEDRLRTWEAELRRREEELRRRERPAEGGDPPDGT